MPSRPIHRGCVDYSLPLRLLGPGAKVQKRRHRSAKRRGRTGGPLSRRVSVQDETQLLEADDAEAWSPRMAGNMLDADASALASCLLLHTLPGGKCLLQAAALELTQVRRPCLGL